MSSAPQVEPSTILARLCHMAVLTREGRLDEVVDHLVLVVLGASGRLTTPDEGVQAIQQLFKVRLDRELIQGAFDRLAQKGAILGSTQGGFVLSPSARAQVVEAADTATRLESAVRAEWLASLTNYDAQTKESLWAALSAYSAQVFLRHGAETAQLLGSPVAMADAAGKPLSAYIEDARRIHCKRLELAEVREVIEDFFTKTTAQRARYVAQQLTAAFTIYALSVDTATSAYLRSTLSPLTIFLDTNCLFALLRIDDSPLAELTRQLIRTIAENDFPFTVCYHTETLGELRRWIDNQAGRLLEHRWLQALSRAAVQSPELGGLERLYHRTNAASPVDARTFVSRYDDLEGLLASHGVQQFKGNLPADDVEERGRRVADYDQWLKTRKVPKEKPYRVVNHDIEVLMAVQALRGSKPPNSLDAGALLLTADFTFSQYARERGRHEVPAVVLPNQLLQLLRPFVATTDDFDKHFVQTFVLPEFRALSIDYTETTSAVLGYLATYKDIGEATAARVLSNRMLMDELKGVPRNTTRFVTLVDKALARDNATLLDERDAAVETLRRERERFEQRLATSKQRADRIREKSEASLQAQILAAQQRADALETEAATYKTQLEEQLQSVADVKKRSVEQRRRLVMAGRIIATATAAAVGALVLWYIPDWTHWTWLVKHPHRLGLQLVAIGTWTGLCVLTGDSSKKSRGPIAAAMTVLGIISAIVDYAH